jgi:hypothetical protein
MSNSQSLPVTLPNGTTIRVEASRFGEQKVAAIDATLKFQPVIDALEGISGALLEGIKKVEPKKATLEFGLEVAVEAGQLTALLVKGSGTSTLKVTLEWCVP